MVLLFALITGWVAACILLVSLVAAASRGDRQLSEGRPRRRPPLWLPPGGVERRSRPRGPVSAMPWLDGRRSTDSPSG
jgi:hypothetical protein